MAESFAIAGKALITNPDGEMLLMKRRPTDVHHPGAWDIPGGRLEPAENPFTGVAREVAEESGLEIEVHEPLGIHYFTRQDGQQITMIVFRCTTTTQEVALSEEHTAYQWLTPAQARTHVADTFGQDIDVYERYYQGR